MDQMERLTPTIQPIGQAEFNGRPIRPVTRVPWSEIGEDFAREWGRRDGKPFPEHMEIIGLTGSGKTYFVSTILMDRVRVRESDVIYIATKPDDDSITELAKLTGWKITQKWRDVRSNPQIIFWPRTTKTGESRKKYQARLIRDLLERVWRPRANVIVVIDETSYFEQGLRLNDLLQMYLREGRALGITMVMLKQRPQGASREVHSETVWAVSFRPKDADDAERVAQLFGSKREYVPVLMSLDPTKREFLIRNAHDDVEYISWVDHERTPVRVQEPVGYRGAPRSRQQ